MGFSKQEYWSGLPFPSPGDLPNPGIKSALTCRFFTTETPNPSNYASEHAIHILTEVVQYGATDFLLPCVIYTPDHIDLAILL